MQLDDPKDSQYSPPVIVHKMEHYIETWDQFKRLFHPEFGCPGQEESGRWTFEESLRRIKAHNKVNTSSLQGINMFSHLTYEEFVEKYTGEEEDEEEMVEDKLNTGEQTLPREWLRKLPESFDWFDTPEMMPAVRKQTCGNCYSYATVGILESRAFLNTRKKTTLSLQQIIDCYEQKRPYCEGGSKKRAMEENPIQFTLKSYPDNPQFETTGTCKTLENTPSLVVGGKTFPQVVKLPKKDELAIRIALVEEGPIAVSFCASNGFKDAHRNGKEPIFRGADDCTRCPDEKKKMTKKVNHAVLIVGYGVEKRSSGEDVKFWNVMNSWGNQWSKDGYFQIERGLNLCNIEEYAMYPKMPKKPGKKHCFLTPYR